MVVLPKVLFCQNKLETKMVSASRDFFSVHSERKLGNFDAALKDIRNFC